MIKAKCHCGAVRIEMDAAPETVTACNCSMCAKLGTLWAHYRPDQVRIEAGPDTIGDYVWGDRMLTFHHCRTCGCATHWSPTDPGVDRMAVNARLVEGHERFPVVYFNGADDSSYASRNAANRR